MSAEKQISFTHACESSGPIPESQEAPPKGISLGKNISWSLLGNIIYAASQWGILILFTRFTTPEEVGRFALALALTTPVIFFSNLQLRSVLATDTTQRFAFRHYQALRYLASSLAYCLFLGMAFFGGYAWETALIICVMGFAKCVEALADMYHGLMQACERMDRLSHSLMWKGGLSLLAVALVLGFGGDMLSACLALSLMWLTVFFTFDIPKSRNLIQASPALLQLEEESGKESWGSFLEKLKKLTLTSLPLGFVMLLISLNFNFPRYVLERYVGEAELGIFAALSYIVIAGNLFIQSMGQSVTPKLSELYFLGHHREFDRLVRKLIVASAGVGLIGFLAALFLGEFGLRLLYGELYAKNNSDFVLIMFTGGVNFIASILWYITTAMRGFRQSVLPFLITAATTILACLVLVPRLGIAGASLAMLASNIVNIFLLWKLKNDLFDDAQCSEQSEM